MSKFVYSRVGKKQENLVVEKNDVGIITQENVNSCVIYFIREGIDISIDKDEFEVINIKKTGDAFPKKICNVCHKLLDSALFDKNQNGKDNRSVRRPSCKECRKNIDGVSMKATEKKKWQKIKPHLEPFECPICNKRTIPGLTSKIVLDHDHDTGKARAWICDSCNTGLGRFKDDIELIEKAIGYLRKELE